MTLTTVRKLTAIVCLLALLPASYEFAHGEIDCQAAQAAERTAAEDLAAAAGGPVVSLAAPDGIANHLCSCDYSACRVLKSRPRVKRPPALLAPFVEPAVAKTGSDLPVMLTDWRGTSIFQFSSQSLVFLRTVVLLH